MGLPCDSEAKYAGWLCTSDCLFVKLKDKVKELGSFWSVLPGSHGVSVNSTSGLELRSSVLQAEKLQQEEAQRSCSWMIGWGHVQRSSHQKSLTLILSLSGIYMSLTWHRECEHILLAFLWLIFGMKAIRGIYLSMSLLSEFTNVLKEFHEFCSIHWRTAHQYFVLLTHIWAVHLFMACIYMAPNIPCMLN